MNSDSPGSGSTTSDQRSSTVCYLCRQRKTKCDRVLPRCGFCVKAKVGCQYVAQPKKRGLRAGYVSHLESRLETLEQEVNHLKDQRQNPLPFVPQTPAAPIATPPAIPAQTPLHIIPSSAQNSIFGSPRSLGGQHTTRRRVNPESEAAVADLMTLPHAYISTLADMWFKESQPWVPILTRNQIQSALESLPLPLTHIDDLVLKAVLALQIKHSSQAIFLGYHGRLRLSDYLRAQVFNEALSKASLSSLQALLVIAILDYGADNIPSTFSLLSVCRRMCESIGLFRKLLKQMEIQHPAQIGPPAIVSNAADELAIPLTWATLALDATTSLGITWRDVSAALVDHLSSVAYVSTPDLKDSFRSHVHLAAIGLQPLHMFVHDHDRGRYDHSRSEALETCDEIYHNLMSYVRSQPSSSYTLLADGLIDFDPYLMQTSLVAHAGAIIMYMPLVEFDGNGLQEVPMQRCLQACEDLVLLVQSISDADCELSSPVMPSMLFVAARFKLIMYRGLRRPREPMFDSLMHGINMNGRRWEVARRLDIVLRAAIMEVDEQADMEVPAVFWNLKKTHLDISEELKEFVERKKHCLYVGALNGPYV